VDVLARLGPQLPEGLRVLDGEIVPPGEQSIVESVRAIHYRVDFPQDLWEERTLSERVAAFQQAEQSVVTRAAPRKGGGGKRQAKVAAPRQREIDLKQIVTHLAVEGPGRVTFSLRADPSGSAKPAEVLAAIFGDGAPPRGVKVLKEGVSLARTTRPGSQGPPRAPRYLDA
jgi:hypothetical protein